MNTSAMLLAVLALGQANPANKSAANDRVATLQHCVVMLIEHVQLPAQQTGVLTQLIAKEGMLVHKDDLLAKIDDQDALLRKKAAEHRLQVEEEKSTNTSEVEAAKKIVEVARAEYDESVAINKRSPGSVPDQQLRRQLLQWERSVLEAVVAQMNMDIAKLEMQVKQAELEAVENELRRIQLKAPFDGVVVELYEHQSEWVQPGDPVLRVVRMDRLRVEGFLNADLYAPEEVLGAPCTITVKITGNRKATFQAKIDHVSPLVEASGDYRVWAEVENRPGVGYPWLLRPGVEAEMLIELNRAPAAAAVR